MKTLFFNYTLGTGSLLITVKDNNDILYQGPNEVEALQVFFGKLENLYKTIGLPEIVYRNFSPESTDFNSYGYFKFISYLHDIGIPNFKLSIKFIDKVKKIISSKFVN